MNDPVERHRQVMRDYYQANKKARAAYMREWRARNRTRARHIQNQSARKRRALQKTLKPNT